MNSSKVASEIRRKRFVREYLKDFNGTAAYQRAGFQAVSRVSRAVGAYKLLKDPRVQTLLRAQAQKEIALDKITSEKVRAEIARIAFSEPDDAIKHAEKLRALELLAKIMQLLKDAPPPAQWNLDPATLAKMSTEDLETALKHAEAVQNLLAGKKSE